MATIVFPDNTKEIIDEIRGIIGRDVTFVVVASSTPCPACGVNPITNTAINSFCTVCSGEGYIYTYQDYVLSGHVTWGNADIFNWYSAGQFFDGDARVQIEYTPLNVTIVDSSVWVEVDGKQMQVKKKVLRGVRPLNRILVDLIERNREA